jgi:hypothetical protein
MLLAFWFRVVLQLVLSEPALEPNLVENVQIFAPSLDLDRVRTYAMAATNAAHAHGLAPELLLGQAFVESRFDPMATSRVVGDKRVTGSWPSIMPAGTGPRFCGPLQTAADQSWLLCLAMRVPVIGYWIGAVELRAWLRVTHGDLRAALGGYGCGGAGVADPDSCGVHKDGDIPYPDRVLAWARRIAARSS